MNRLVMLLIANMILLLASRVASADSDNMFMVKQAMSYMAPRCGDGHPLGNRLSLVEYCWNDTNRLVSALKQIALTNSEYYATFAMKQLGEYGTPADLPFLYSCATNPVCGDCAIKSIIAIEGVTSNSIAAAQSYFNSTNNFPRKKAYERSLLCEKLLQDVYGDDALSQYRPYVMDVALDFAQNVNTMHISLDEALVGADPSYRYSKRRLAVMRAAQMNCINQTLTNYVTNAINELVAYPESELPD